MKMLVLGATGTVGSEVVRSLLQDGQHIRILTRHPDKAQHLGGPVDVHVGDLTKPETLGPAFDGVNGLFLLNSVSMTEAQEGLTALELAKRAGVGHIVYLSVHRVDDAPHIPHFSMKVGIEAAIRKSGVGYTILRPSNYFQNDLAMIDAIVNGGVYPQPLGSIGLNRVDVRDIAAAAVQAFAGRARNQTISLVGPDVLTGTSIAQIYSRHLGRTITYAGNDLEAWATQVSSFLPAWMVFDFTVMYAHYQKEGLLATDQELEILYALLGHAPRGFDAFVSETLSQSGR